jgi:hypothetical protein
VKRCPPEDLLARLAQDDLAESEADLVIAHVLTCDRCRRLLEEYKEAFVILRAEKTVLPTHVEWERVMAGVRQRTQARSSGWTVWQKVAAVAAAAACVLIILWQAGGWFGKRPGETLDYSEGTVVSQQPEQQVLLGEGDSAFLDGSFAVSDTTYLSLAGLNEEELEELDELITGAGILRSSDLLVLDLTEEEETELVNELENQSPI